jgi:hypothetical protein
MCTFCNDTGSLSKDLDGFLDCGHCHVAEERTALDVWAGAHGLDCYYSAHLWQVYQHGKAAAAGQNQ